MAWVSNWIQGIIVTVRDLENEEMVENIDSGDLILIINSLRAAGAEAISINDERIITMSDIVDINEGGYIKVNLEKRIFSPYVIKAIGDPAYLESSLIGNGGHVDKLKKAGHEISIEQKDKVTINKYDEEIKTKYIVD